MREHADKSVTLSEEEYKGFLLISQMFNKIIPHLEDILHLMDEFEDEAHKLDHPRLFIKERVN